MEDSHFLLSKLNYKTAVIRKVSFRLWVDTYVMAQNLRICGQLIFDKDAKTALWGNGLFQHVVLGQLDTSMQKDEVPSLPLTLHKNTVNHGPNVRAKT